MKNKLLLLVIIILLPISLFIKEKKVEELQEEVPKEIVVNLKTNDKILNLNLNEYLIGVVGAEMPASFNMEALKAQTIASRTFAYNYLNDNNIDIDTNAQNFADNNTLKDKFKDNYDKYINIINEAVSSTDNLVIKYKNEIIKSYYFSMSNGKTESSLAVFNEELPYLESVDSNIELNLKNMEVEKEFTYSNFCELLNINSCEVQIDNVVRDETNRVEKITINNHEYTGIEIRKLLNLRSTDFNIELNESNIIIRTKGYGHGVGMSQYGANELANIGYNYIDILKYYYKDVEIENY